jgi:hypothetical protein
VTGVVRAPFSKLLGWLLFQRQRHCESGAIRVANDVV